MKKEKFYFPELADHITNMGWTKAQFEQKARLISEKPSPRGWSLLMKKDAGMTKSYVVNARNTLEKLGFSNSVLEYHKVSSI